MCLEGAPRKEWQSAALLKPRVELALKAFILRDEISLGLAKKSPERGLWWSTYDHCRSSREKLKVPSSGGRQKGLGPIYK